MARKTDTINGGMWGKKFSGELDPDVCDRYNNADLTVISKIHLVQGNPAAGANRGTTPDSDGTSVRIKKWDREAWNWWSMRFKSVCQLYSGKFWLINNLKWNKYEDRKVEYYPNIWCRLKLELVKTAAEAHHAITVYRVSWDDRLKFRSHFEMMSSFDTELMYTGKDSAGKKIHQRSAVHEYFHTLGVRHVDHGEANCPAGDGGNANTCYGDTDDDMHTLMGKGMSLNAKFADPWRRAAVKLTGKGNVATAADWKPVLLRHYPRTVDEESRNEAITRKPNRK